MARAKEPQTKMLIGVPASWKARLEELMVNRHESLSAYMRALMKKEILSHGPMPASRRSSTPPGDTPHPTTDSVPPPAA